MNRCHILSKRTAKRQWTKVPYYTNAGSHLTSTPYNNHIITHPSRGRYHLSLSYGHSVTNQSATALVTLNYRVKLLGKMDETCYTYIQDSIQTSE